jgi:two-component system LytT family response regulator
MGDPIRVLVADDESVARKRLSRLLSEMDGVERVGECGSGAEVLDRIDAGDVDVLLLDIQMPGMTGLETKAIIGEEGPYVIFTTAHPEHALEAFEVGAVDYVLKPIDADRLERAIRRAERSLAAAVETVMPAREPATFDRLAVPTRRGVKLVDPRWVSHAVFDGQLVTMHLTTDGAASPSEAVLTDYTLQELCEALPVETFERVHRRALVNLLEVDRLEPVASGGYIAVMRGGERVDVSRQAARRLRRRLGIT